MQEQFYALLAKNGEKIDDEKAEIFFNDHSIDILEIYDDGSNGYGEKLYSVNEAYNRLKQMDAIKKL